MQLNEKSLKNVFYVSVVHNIFYVLLGITFKLVLFYEIFNKRYIGPHFISLLRAQKTSGPAMIAIPCVAQEFSQ